MAKIAPVILCGGSGTRLWPRSRKTKPKPFLPLVGDTTLFEQAVLRCDQEEGFTGPIIVTGIAHLDHVDSQLVRPETSSVIIEPEGKNTAAAIALAAARVSPDTILLVCPSDHHIGDWPAFVAAARAGAELAADDWLVAFGIVPTTPETGFGYMKQGEPIPGTAGFGVEQFIEKPDLVRATSFLDAGGYVWNAGIFAFRAGAFLAALDAYRPAIAAAVRASIDAGKGNERHFYPDATEFAAIDSESVDYAVMENATRVAVVPVSMAWSDIGNWKALHEALDKDGEGNVTRGDVELKDCTNVLVDSDGPRVSVIGVSDVVIVVDGNDVLVTTADGVQLVGKLGGAVNQ